MEGDAKGQVGGMEMPRNERERLARESRGWRCRGCGGRSNEEILKEEGEKVDGEKETKQEIPEELRFGFKDQMEKREEKVDKGKGKEVLPVISSTADTALKDVAPPQHTISPPQRAQATTTAPIAQTSRPTPSTTPRTSADGVPLWVDKAITGVVAALALLIIKKILV